MQEIEIPKIMRFTVLPYRIVARAWLDPTFEDALLRYPKAFLLEKSPLFPREYEYMVLRDTPETKHFIIPHLDDKLRTKPNEEVAALLKHEIGDDDSFSEFLPASVLAKCYEDSHFKKNLIINPQKVLSNLDYDLPYLPKIIENSETVFHIPLRYNTVKRDDFISIYRGLADSDVIIASTKCCATGTCNDDKEAPVLV